MTEPTKKLAEREEGQNPHSSHPQPSIRSFFLMIIRMYAVLAVLAGLLFLPAGRWDWPDAWIFIIAYGSFLTIYGIWGQWKDPEQLNERNRVVQNVKAWDKVILSVYTLFLLVTFILAGLDAGRFRLSFVPPAIKALAWLGLAGSGSLIFWSLATNTYLSRMARIQDDRGQVVVSSGPYQYVRHPMYLGIIIMFLCVPIALGSYWALIPGGAIAALFVLRTSKEDEMLKQELPGYPAYSRSVRYRLFPGVW